MSDLVQFNDYIKDEIDEQIEQFGGTSTEHFAHLISNRLVQNGTIENFSYHYFDQPEVHGYSYDLGYSFCVYISIYKPQSKIETIDKNEIKNAINEGKKFFNLVNSQDYPKDKKDENYYIFKEIKKIDLEIPRQGKGKIIILTNSKSPINQINNINLKNYLVEVKVLDINEIYKEFFNSNADQATDIHFKKLDPQMNVQCIPILNEKNKKLKSYIAVIPGRMIYDIYSNYGSKILQQNVRGFLSSSGKINKNIKKTILEEPELFFSYNNGISILGTDISLKIVGSQTIITSIKGFQIVNGGQTTSSIFFTKKAHIEAQIRDIDVLAKISIVNNQEKNKDILENIALYNNSQNNISLPDLSSNSEFNIDMEKISNRLKTTKGNFWFFERHRGDYSLKQKNASNSKVALKDFKSQFPKKQLITKEKLAKILVSWKKFPYESCKGAAKVFTFFTEEIVENIKMIDEKFFKTLISQLILFNSIYGECKKMKLTGGKANWCTIYLFSILSEITGGKLNIKFLWENHEISHELKNEISDWLLNLSKRLDEITLDQNTSLGECVKKIETWEDVKKSNIINKKNFVFPEFN